MRVNFLNPSIYSLRSSIHFGVNRDTGFYDTVYKEEDKFNGALPDEFVLNKLNQYFPKSQNINVLDIGAGQGRNSCPIAKKGYNVTAFELSQDGRASILQKAEENFVSKNLTALDQDILIENPEFNNKYNFVFMSHVTQIFNEDKLDTVLSNIKKSMKKDGVLVFDALIRNKEQEKIKPSEEFSKSGYYNYCADEIAQIAESHGFELKEISDYNENSNVKSFYIDHPKWNENVKLKWFVFKL